MSLSPLQDQYGRYMRKLRISLLDACNFRCVYCMPENATFSERHDLLTPTEIFDITKVLCDFGLEEVRLTGGEPTLRHEFVEVVERLSKLPLKRIGVTTNAYRLEKLIPSLRKTNLRSINVSLDSLDPVNFKNITKSNDLENVLAGIFAAQSAGMEVKINVVLMQQNFHEWQNFVEFASTHKIEVRFLELMKIGVVLERFQKMHVPIKTLLASMKNEYVLSSVAVDRDSTSFKYRLNNDATIGFIASETMPFCHSCSRLRLDSKGVLRSCLMSEEGLSLRNISSQDYSQIISRVVAMKPMTRIENIAQPMYQIGG